MFLGTLLSAEFYIALSILLYGIVDLLDIIQIAVPLKVAYGDHKTCRMF